MFRTFSKNMGRATVDRDCTWLTVVVLLSLTCKIRVRSKTIYHCQSLEISGLDKETTGTPTELLLWILSCHFTRMTHKVTLKNVKHQEISWVVIYKHDPMGYGLLSWVYQRITTFGNWKGDKKTSVCSCTVPWIEVPILLLPSAG